MERPPGRAMTLRSILVLTHELPPLGGGAGRAMAQLCQALRERGVDITVWTQQPPAAVRMDFPFRVRYFATGRTAQFQTHIPSMLIYSARILFSGLWIGLRSGTAGGHARERPDLILSNTAIPAGCIGALLGRFLRVPHAIWYHGADIHGNRAEGAGLLYRFLLKAAWRNTALHCFVSLGLLRMAEGYGGMRSPGMVLPLFSDPIAPEAPAAPGAGASGAADSRPGRVFLFTGRLEKVKDPLLFLRAIAHLKLGNLLPADAGFRIVGGGALFGTVRRAIDAAGLADLVSLEPPVPGAAMGRIYGQAFALVLTSVVEGFPLTILEAGLCGVPAIGSDTLGINEEIGDGRTGLLFARNDHEACARAILRLLGETGLRDELGRNARNAALALTSARSAALFLEAADRLDAGAR